MFFEDREVIYQGDSPSGRWGLTVYAPKPGAAEEVPADPEKVSEPGPTYYAEFEKNNGRYAIAHPFGGVDPDKELQVDWALPGKVCSISLSGELFLLFKWGVCFLRPREINKVESEGAITPEEKEEFLAKALKENHD